MATKTQLKQYFKTGLKPTEGQFAELIDSMFNVGEDTFTIAMVNGLSNALAGKATAAQVSGLLSQVSTLSGNVNGLAGFVGDLALLNTTDKSTLVAAINELQANSGGFGVDDLGQGLIIEPGTGRLTLDLASKPLVTPTIAVAWTVYNNDGSNPVASTATALVVDKGCKVDMAARYKYAPNAAQAAPKAAASASFTTNLPPSDTLSEPLTVNNITANRADAITLLKPKSGLVVSGSQVAFPSGNDTTSASISVNFRGRGTLVTSFGDAALTAAQIQSVLNGAPFVTSKAATYNSVTATGGKYVYYLRDAALGRPTNVIQNGALPVFKAFQFLADVTITNAAGFQMPVTVMRSNDLDAFNNAILDFA